MVPGGEDPVGQVLDGEVRVRGHRDEGHGGQRGQRAEHREVDSGPPATPRGPAGAARLLANRERPAPTRPRPPRETGFRPQTLRPFRRKLCSSARGGPLPGVRPAPVQWCALRSLVARLARLARRSTFGLETQ